MRVWTLVPLLLVGALAGCVGTDDKGAGREALPEIPLDWSDRALVYGDDHDHADPAHHQNLTTPNFEILGYDPLISPYYGTTAGSYFCGDAQATQDGRRIAAVESRSDVGFALADVTDPAAPRFLGELVMQHTYVYDLAVVPDGKHVVLTTAQVRTPSVGQTTDQSTPKLLWRSPCVPGGEIEITSATQDPLPRPASNLLVDISDPSSPQIVDQRPAGGLGHSVFATLVDDRPVALVSVWASAEQASSFQFYEIIDTPLGSRLELLSVYSVAQGQEPGEAGRQSGHNDGWIATHPGTGQALAYLGNWDAGVHILDLADMRTPKLVGTWVPGAACCGSVHSLYPLPDLKDGRHYTLVGPEWPARPSAYLPTGIVWVLDTTDPSAPKEIAGWTLPHDVEWSGRLMWSNHYLSAVNDTMFVSMYHGGVWAIDLSVLDPDNFTSLPSIGVFMPVTQPPEEASVQNRWAPTQQEVLAMPDGTLVTFDGNTGIYTFRFDATRPAPAPEPWPISPVTWTP